MVLEIKPRLSLIIPAYNEAGRIESTLKDLIRYRNSLFDNEYEMIKMIIVMDGCTDGTPEIVKEIINNYSYATTLIISNRLGKGGAIIEALKHSRGDIVAFIDADGSIPARELTRLAELTRNYDLVIGSRYEKDSIISRRPLKRIIFSRAFNVLLKLLFWKLRAIKDSQCGVKVFTRSLLDEIEEDLIITDFAFDVNLIYSALCRGFKVKEVGITWMEKDGSRLAHRLTKQAIVMTLSLLRLRLYYSLLRKMLSVGPLGKIAKRLYLSCSAR